MDAKERLRQYLEQRRDLGETELVLDSLSVDDVLKLLGAGGGGARGIRADAPAPPHTRAASGAADAPPSHDERETRNARDARDARVARVAPTDWREALRAADIGEAAPGAAKPEIPLPPVRRSGPRTDAERAPAPPTPPSPQREGAGVARGPVDSGGPEQEPLDAQTREVAAAAPDDRSAPDDMSPRAKGGKRATEGESSKPAAKGTPAPGKSSVDELPEGLVVGSAAPELFGDAAQFRSLEEIAEAVHGCERCRLYATAKHGVPGEGNAKAELVCVGEAPGANEDETGRPFVGQAGQLLTKILAAIDLAREDVFIVNVLKHRPPGNRNPLPDEVTACSPYLVRQIELIRPKVIVAFGTFAAQTLLQTKETIGKLRGRIHRYHGVPLIVTYHPAALLRNPSWKRPTWEDVQLARRLLDRAADA